MRLFIGAPITDEVREKCKEIVEVIRRSGVKAKIVEPNNMHITLKFLGEVPGTKVDEIKNAMDLIEYNIIEAETTRVGAFPNPMYVKVIWLGVDSEGLIEVVRNLDNKLEPIGFRREKNFIPHITLARIKEKPNKSLVELIGQEVRIPFQIREMDLVKSTLTREGPIYEVIHKKEFV